MKKRSEEWLPKWVALPILDFVRKVHSLKDDPERLRDWIVDFADALMIGDRKSGCEMANAMISAAVDRFSKKSRAGRIGGIASGVARNARNGFSNKIKPPSGFEEVADFAVKYGLDVDDARLWWQRNFVDRPGCDKDGVVFDNWKGALVNACRAEAKKRQGEVK